MAGTGIATAIAGCSQSEGEPTSTGGSTETTTTATAATGDGTTTTEETTAEPDATPPDVGACALRDVDGECDDPETYDSDFTEDTTIGADCDKAVVKGFLDMDDGVTVTVAPGTRVEFEENAGIVAESDTAFKAQGSCEDPILLTGAESTRGHWRGIAYEGSNQPENVLKHVTIEYGGGPLAKNGWDNQAKPSNLVVINSRVSVDSCTIRESPEYGASIVRDETAVDSFEGNHVTENGVAPVFASPRDVHFLSDGSSYTGNADDRIEIERGRILEAQSVTWDDLDVRYVPRGRIDLYGDLDVAAGTTVSFGEDTYIDVDDSARLRANGLDSETEEVDEILFTAEDERRGHWKGLIFDGANQSENVLRNVTLEYGGGRLPDPTIRSRAKPANVTAWNSRLSVDDCTMRESAAWGVAFRGEDAPMTVESFNGNALTSNAKGAAYVTDNKADVLSSRSTYTGNDEDRVLVEDKYGITEAATWDAIDVRYVVDGRLAVDADVTIDPGATLSFAQDGAVYVDDGSLYAEGIDPDTGDEAEITFTAEDGLASFWKGLVFDDSFTSSNLLRNVTVEYAGGDLWSATLRAAAKSANVISTEGSRVVVEDSTIAEGGSFGIWVSDDSELVESGNTFTNNAGQDVQRET